MKKLTFLLLLALLVACGSDDSSSNGSGGNASGPDTIADTDAFATEWADVLCEKIDTCFAGFAEILAGPNCRDDWKNRIITGLDAFNASAEAGRLTFDSDAWASCVDSARAASCEGLQFDGIFGLLECGESITGNVADGESCGIDLDCAEASFCLNEPTDACGGVCTPKYDVGTSCDRDDACSNGVCREVCAEIVAEGEACDENETAEEGQAPRVCASGFGCGISEGEMEATCRVTTPTFEVTEGQPCGTEEPSNLCEPDLFCGFNEDFSLSCKPRVALGETCGVGFLNSCQTGAACVGIDVENMIFTGTCEALPGDGEPCLPEGLFRCESGLACTEAGVCERPGLLGEACDTEEQCFSGRCEADADGNKVCVAQPVCAAP